MLQALSAIYRLEIQLGREEDATRTFERAMACHRKHWKNNPALSYHLRAGAIFLTGLKRYPEAEALAAESISVAEEFKHWPYVADAHEMARVLYESQGKFAEVIAHSEAAWKAAAKGNSGWRAIELRKVHIVMLIRANDPSYPAMLEDLWKSVSQSNIADMTQEGAHRIAHDISAELASWWSKAPATGLADQIVRWRNWEAETISLDARQSSRPGHWENTLKAILWRAAGWVENGKMEDYNRQRAELLGQAAKDSDATLARTAAIVALLSPDGTADMKRIRELLDTGYAGTSKSEPKFGAFYRGLAHYRAGEYAPCLGPVTK